MTTTVRAGQPTTTAPQGSNGTVWVGPFANISGGEGDRWIGAGLVETLTAELPRVAGLGILRRGGADVEPTSEPERLMDERTALRVATELGATWLVAGGYQRVGDRIRITARLVDVATSTVAYTGRVDGVVADLFDLQDRVVDVLGAELRTVGSARRSRALAGTTHVNPRYSDVAPAPSSERAPSVDDAASATTVAVPRRPPAGLAAAPTPIIDGPPPPVPPATVARDTAGRATLRAVRVTEPVRIDGVLDERAYQDVPPASAFIQVEPVEGALATEQTEIWILFDRDNVYLSGRCFDSAPESEWVANEMRRDGMGLGEFFGVYLDTFYDRRNAVAFIVNPLGGRMDGQITNERAWNGDWNPVWDVRAGRFDGGWTFEMAIPFKSLRYRPGPTQTWGIQLERLVAWKNEYSTLTQVPASRGMGAAMLMSQAATLVDLEVPDAGLNLEVKPYAIGDVGGARTSARGLSTNATGDIGLDVKYGVTENLVVDFTVNTDFAQVEADEQQVNLTRFSLFFPEKREFFLENQGQFAFGGEASGGLFAGASRTPILFYSRQIGLNQGREVPIDAGGRLTGRLGKFSVGALNIRTADAPVANAAATNFTVLSLRRDLLRRSSIGALFTGRSVSQTGIGSNEAYGVDGLFAFHENLNISTYWAKTRTEHLGNDDVSYSANLDYRGDRYGLQLERLIVGDDFNPEVGFLRRDDFARSFGSVRFSPRPASIAAIRKLTWEGQFDYITDRDGVLETRQAQGRFNIELENSDGFQLTYTRNYELLKRPFPIAPDVTIPVGGYDFADVEAAYTFGRQRRISGRVAVQHGDFYGGEKTTVNFGFGGGFYSGTRIELTPQLALEPSISLNRITLPQGRFTAELASTRVIYSLTPLMFVSALVQYDASTDAVSTNLRLRWEYSPGSELFVVYNEQRESLVPQRSPELQNRALVIKVNRLFRF